MLAFDSLRQFFAPTDATIALPSDPFIVIDRDRAATKLRLAERGERNGRKNYPSPEATTLDDVEQEIVAEISEHAVRAQIAATTNHRVYGERLSELTLLRQLATITGASARALGDFRAIVINQRGRLSLAKDAIRESYDDLARFKREHGLFRPAYNGLSLPVVWATIGAAWLVESLANTAFLRVNDEFGLIGGFIAAAVVAAVNVGVSAFVGRYVWPHAVHKAPARKLAALAGGSAWLALIVAWNLLAGHFRDAKARGLPDPEAAALQLFGSNPLQFDSLYSYGLLAAGIIFALLAAVAAFKADDPYPGYGETYRRHETRCEDYAEEIRLAIEEVTDTRDDAIESAVSIKEELSRQFRERGQIIAARDLHRTRYRQHQDYLEAVANALLSQYRAANIQHRPDGAHPSHFDRKWALERSELPLDADAAVTEAEVAASQRALTTSIETITKAYSDAIESFEHLEAIKESLKHGA